MSNPYQAPAPIPDSMYPPPSGEGDHTGGVIPYKNPYALIAYYSGLFGLFCCFTPLPLGVIPLVLGIIGLRNRARNPIIKGSVHAWIGIVLGGFSALVSLLLALVLIIGALNSR